jgi:hypothetical protein
VNTAMNFRIPYAQCRKTFQSLHNWQRLKKGSAAWSKSVYACEFAMAMDENVR